MATTLKIAALLCLLPTAQIALAHTAGEGYVHDTQIIIVRDGHGDCVKTPRWNSNKTITECEGAIATAPVAERIKEAIKADAAKHDQAARKDVPAQQAAVANVPIEPTAEVLFDTDMAELKPEAKSAINNLVKQIKSVDYEQIIIVGHADHSGSSVANQHLSARRANAVHNYLIGAGIPSSKIDSNAKGDNQPVTRPDDCAGLKSEALRTCLAPDRRVTIRVVPTKAKQ